MTPDPSGAARAPQPLAELLAEVRGELAKTFSSDPNVCFPAASAIEKNARAWLGALVQAVEDQQTEVSRLRADGQRLRDALEEISGLPSEITVHRNGEALPVHCRRCDKKRDVARAALASPRNE